MIKSIYTLFALFLLHVAAYSQPAGSKDPNAKIAEILALQPAETPDRFDAAMRLLEKFSPAEIATLFKQLHPPGKGDNAKIEYATNSYSYHVMLPGKTAQRAAFIQGTLLALDAITDNDNKGYLIQMLQNAGDDTAVEKLGTYLTDDYLSEKASRALARIQTESAGAALLDALANATDKTAIQLINALGFIPYPLAEQLILEKSKENDPALRRAAYYALSQIGGKASESVLRDAAHNAGYGYEPTQATSAYLNYATRLAAQGEQALATRIASRMFKAAGRAQQTHTRGAALALLTAINPRKQEKALIKAARDSDGVYRNIALNILAPRLTDQVSTKLVKGLARQPESVQADILWFLGEHEQQNGLPVVNELLHSPSSRVRIAATDAYYRLRGDAAVPDLLQLLPSGDGKVDTAIQEILLTSGNGQLPNLVMDALAIAEDVHTQRLLVGVLAQRGVGESMPIMVAFIKNNTPSEVQAAAYEALPQVARPEDLPILLELLPGTSADMVPFVQQATITAVNRSENNKAAMKQQVISSLQRVNASGKAAYLPILSGIGGSEALNVIAGYTAGSDTGLRDAAIAASAIWVGEEALPNLVTLSRTLTDGNQLDAIIRGLVRLVGVADLPADQKVLMLRDAFEEAQTADQKKLILRALEANKTYNAIIFAGNFLDDEELRSTAANTVMNIALETPDLYGEDLTRLLNKVTGILSGSESSYLREAIRKHLAELPQDSGYVSLLQNDNLSGWKGLVADPIKRRAMDKEALAAAQEKADEQMRQGWYAADGVLHFRGKGDNIATVKQYGNIEMLVDWKLAKDGKDGDAGVYLRGTPQVQIWDISRINVGAQVGSGGLYNNQKHESKPLVVADNELGEWNTFYIKMVDDRVTVYLNGVLVTDDVVLENFWDRSQPIFPIEQIELQAHGTEVSYRDIYIRELPQR